MKALLVCAVAVAAYVVAAAPVGAKFAGSTSTPEAGCSPSSGGPMSAEEYGRLQSRYTENFALAERALAISQVLRNANPNAARGAAKRRIIAADRLWSKNLKAWYGSSNKTGWYWFEEQYYGLWGRTKPYAKLLAPPQLRILAFHAGCRGRGVNPSYFCATVREVRLSTRSNVDRTRLYKFDLTADGAMRRNPLEAQEFTASTMCGASVPAP